MAIPGFLARLGSRLVGAMSGPAGRAVGTGAAMGAGFAGAERALAGPGPGPGPMMGPMGPPGGGPVPMAPRGPRGRAVTVEYTVFPDGTRVPKRVTPGGVALYKRDLSAAKRVQRVVREAAGVVGLKAVNRGRKLRKA